MKSILIAFTLFFCTFQTAFSHDFQLGEKGQRQNAAAFETREILFENEDFFLAFYYSSLGEKSFVYLEKVKKSDLSIVFNKRLDWKIKGDKKAKNISPNGIRRIGTDFYFFRTKRLKDQKKAILQYREMSLGGEFVEENYIDIMDLNLIDVTHSRDGIELRSSSQTYACGFDMESSANDEFILITQGVVNNNQGVSLKVFNKQFKLVNSFEKELAGEVFALKKAWINNNGELFCLGQRFVKVDNLIPNIHIARYHIDHILKEEKYVWDLITISNGIIVQTPIEIEEGRIVDFLSLKNIDNQVNLAGTYEINGEKSGVFVAVLDIENSRIVKKKAIEFKGGAEAQMLKAIRAKDYRVRLKKDKWLYKDERELLKNYKSSKFCIRNDNSFVLILEYKELFKHSSSSKDLQVLYPQLYLCNDLFVYSFDANFELEWVKRVPKSFRSQSGNTSVASYSSSLSAKTGRLNFYFIDDPKNDENIKKGKELKKLTNYNINGKASLSRSGDLVFQANFIEASSKFGIYHNLGNTFQSYYDDHLYLYFHRMNSYRWAKIKVD